MDLEPLMTAEDLCKRYTCTPITLRRWIADGSLPQPVRLGRRKVFWPVKAIVEHERIVRGLESPLEQLIPNPGVSA